MGPDAPHPRCPSVYPSGESVSSGGVGPSHPQTARRTLSSKVSNGSVPTESFDVRGGSPDYHDPPKRRRADSQVNHSGPGPTTGHRRRSYIRTPTGRTTSQYRSRTPPWTGHRGGTDPFPGLVEVCQWDPVITPHFLGGGSRPVPRPHLCTSCPAILRPHVPRPHLSTSCPTTPPLTFHDSTPACGPSRPPSCPTTVGTESPTRPGPTEPFRSELSTPQRTPVCRPSLPVPTDVPGRDGRAEVVLGDTNKSLHSPTGPGRPQFGSFRTSGLLCRCPRAVGVRGSVPRRGETRSQMGIHFPPVSIYQGFRGPWVRSEREGGRGRHPVDSESSPFPLI